MWQLATCGHGLQRSSNVENQTLFTQHCLCCWLCGQTRRKPSREKEDDSDGDSSVCEELIEEPVKEDLTSKEQTTNEDRFVVMRT